MTGRTAEKGHVKLVARRSAQIARAQPPSAISVVLTLYGLFRRLRRQSVLVVPVLALGATAAALALSSEALGLPAELTPLQRALVSLSIAFNAALVMRIFSGK